MLIRKIQEALEEYDRSEKSWWQKLFGPPSTIKRLKLFFVSLSVPPLAVDLARELTNEEMFRLYQTLLAHADREHRKNLGVVYDYYKDKDGGQQFNTQLSWLKTLHAKILARLFHKNFCTLTLEILEDLKITQELFTAVQQHAKPIALKESVETLKKNGLLSEANVIALTQHPEPEKLSEALELLSKQSYLNQTRFDLVKHHPDPEKFAKQTNPTTSEIRSYLAEYDQKKGFFRRYIYKKDPPGIAELRAFVSSFGEEVRGLTEDEEFKLCQLFSFEMHSTAELSSKLPKNTYITGRLSNHFKYKYIAFKNLGFYFNDLLTLDLFKLFSTLPETEQRDIGNLFFSIHAYIPSFMNQEMVSLLFKNKTPTIISSVIARMSKDNMLTPENLSILTQVIKEPDGASLHSLGYLAWNFGFNQTNFTAVINYPTPGLLSPTLRGFVQTKKFTQADFESAVKYAHILGHPDVLAAFKNNFEEHFGSLPPQYTETMTRVIEFCKTSKSTEENMLREVIRIINLGDNINFNRRQNTHTESVHKTASESAKRLWASYSERLDTFEKQQRILAEIEAWTKTLPGEKKAIAGRAITRLQLPAENYLDPVSQITNIQLLMLFWLAIHDETKYADGTTVEDAQSQLYDALYEIQRGLNLILNNNGTLVDNREIDNSICPSGSFNKFIEKLFTLHVDADMQSITQAGALSKFPIVVREEASKHLASHRKTMELTDFEGLKKRLLEDGGIDIIWPAIKDPVNLRMMDEFGTLYQTEGAPDINHKNYQLILGGLPFVDLTKLSIFTNAELLTNKTSSATFTEKSGSSAPPSVVKQMSSQPPENRF